MEQTSTKERLIEAGKDLLLKHGYNHLGVQELLAATGIPKGSFYHHFESKEDFALQVVDRYMEAAHVALDACLNDQTRPPLQRVRRFFEMIRESYASEGNLGCLLGGLGQELSGISPVFRRRIDDCLSEIATRLATCLHEAVDAGELARDADPQHLANLLVDCWEGAALRARLLRDSAPLTAMLDFYFGLVPARKKLARTPTRVRGARRRRRS